LGVRGKKGERVKGKRLQGVAQKTWEKKEGITGKKEEPPFSEHGLFTALGGKSQLGLKLKAP